VRNYSRFETHADLNSTLVRRCTRLSSRLRVRLLRTGKAACTSGLYLKVRFGTFRTISRLDVCLRAAQDILVFSVCSIRSSESRLTVDAEPRRHCGGCGGSFCSADAQHCEGFEKRYCVPCRLQLAQGLVGSRRTSLERGLDSRRGSLVG
jgi:hypothetical protein